LVVEHLDVLGVHGVGGYETSPMLPRRTSRARTPAMG